MYTTFSKTFEHFVLEKLKTEVKPRHNQYGGLKGCGTNQYLLDAWNFILSAMDDEKGPAINLISVDYAKAFNTMKHQSCIEQFRWLGASMESIRMIHTFLEGRTMSVRINEAFSELRPVPRGSPQGTILGNYLFVIATDNLEDPEECEADPAEPSLHMITPSSSDDDSFYSAREDLLP